ncbi:MAG: ABC transporter permease [Lachnospiraceae bacterium]|nr:ABC transporter permease [Lachnospiraceae bacterium]
MNRNQIYLRLQLKKVLQLLPRLIGFIIVLAVLVSVIAIYGTKLLYNKKTAQKVTIAIVVEDSSPLMDFGMTYLEASESVNTFCRLVKTSKREAEQMVKDHTAAAYIYFPPHFAKDIADGKNTPAVITFSDHTGVEQLLFQELTSAAARILTYAQAGIYSLGDVYDNYEFHKKRSVHYDYINQNTMKTALIRSRLFQVEQISSTGSVSTKEYYTASALVLLFFLSGMSLSRLAQPESSCLSLLLSRQGLGSCKRTLLKYTALLVFYLVVWAFLFLVCCMFSLLPWRAFLLLPLFSVTASAWTLLLYSITNNETTGTLLLFLLVFLGAFCSGCLLPLTFLPQALSRAAAYLPMYYMHKLVCILYTELPGLTFIVPLLVFSFIFLGLSCLFAAKAERRNS